MSDGLTSSRREFLRRSGAGLAGALLASALPGCSLHRPTLPTPRLLGAGAAMGHLLRTPEKLPPPSHTEHVETLIIGGGVAGLSVRRELHHQNAQAPLLLELADTVGGNAVSGQNQTSAYPWGAHYLPIPDERDADLVAFLQAAGVITGFDAEKRPVFNEYQLCHDPEERLLIRGHWQAGLVPEVGVPAEERAQIQRFFTEIEQWRQAKGLDGKDAFAIPLDGSSADAAFRQLDNQTFASYLDQRGYTAPHLRWYLDYCCTDDYGATAATVSAWAGLHYFAARKGRGANATNTDVLTWPEGNAFLVSQLRAQGAGEIRTQTLAFDLRETPEGVRVLTYDAHKRQTTTINARRVVLATPWHVTQRLLAQVPDAPVLPPLHHTPWLIANLTVDGLPQGPGQPLCWDNVRFGSGTGGYVNANQQDVHQPGAQRVITFYWPLTEQPPAEARKIAYTTPPDEWLRRIVAELELMHPGVSACLLTADLWVWGHGMIAPTPGYVWGEARRNARQPLNNRFFFAHTDLSGVSIFEEGFHQGIRAAREILALASHETVSHETVSHETLDREARNLYTAVLPGLAAGEPAGGAQRASTGPRFGSNGSASATSSPDRVEVR